MRVFVAKYAREAVAIIEEDGRGDASAEIKKMLVVEVTAKILALGRREITSILTGFLEVRSGEVRSGELGRRV